ncbi:MAG: GNAT family N-acetyltransferase, partial [Pseudomonadota bacterium]
FGFELQRPTASVDDSASEASQPEGQTSSASDFEYLTLQQIPRRDIERLATEMMTIAETLYVDAESRGEEGIFPIDPRFMNSVYSADFHVGLSQAVLNQEGQVVGFNLSYFDEECNCVHLEKFGVREEDQGKGISRRLLQHLSSVALTRGIPTVELLVRKGNSKAMQIYEHFGFENVTPMEYRNDPRANAYKYSVRTSELYSRVHRTEQN